MYTQVGETENCEFKVTRLFEGNEYVFQVTAENDIGIGEPAELSQGITPESPFCKFQRHYQSPFVEYLIFM